MSKIGILASIGNKILSGGRRTTAVNTREVLTDIVNESYNINDSAASTLTGSEKIPMYQGSASVFETLDAVAIYISALSTGTGIVKQTAAQWALDTTVYGTKKVLVTSDVFYTGTDQPRFKFANGADTWSNLDYIPEGPTNIWNLDGNIVGAEKFIGTIDNFDLPFRANNIEGMRLTKTGQLGIGTVAPNVSSLLDIASTTKGVLLPRMTTAERNLIGTPATSLLIYNTSTSLFNYYDGATWQSLDSTVTSEWLLNGNVLGNDTTWIGSSDNFDFSFRTNNIERIRVNKDGFVGIGITAPTTLGGRFQVDQSSYDEVARFRGFFGGSFDAFTIDKNGNTISGAYSSVASGFSLGASALLANTVNSPDTWVWEIAGAEYQKILGVSTFSNLACDFKFTDQFGSPLLQLYNQNTGIGLAAPTARLHAKGTTDDLSTYVAKFDSLSINPLLYIRNDGAISIGTASADGRLNILGSDNLNATRLVKITGLGGLSGLYLQNDGVFNIYTGGVFAIGTDIGSNFISNNYSYFNEAVNFGSGMVAASKVFQVKSDWRVGIGGNDAGSKVYIDGTGFTNALSVVGNFHITEEISQILGKYNFMAASNSSDTIGDVRFYSTYAASISTFFIEKCTVANATKGAGTWVAINSFAL